MRYFVFHEFLNSTHNTDPYDTISAHSGSVFVPLYMSKQWTDAKGRRFVIVVQVAPYDVVSLHATDKGSAGPGMEVAKNTADELRAAAGAGGHSGRGDRQDRGAATGGREPQGRRGPADAHRLQAQTCGTPRASWHTNSRSAVRAGACRAHCYRKRQAGGLDRAARWVADHSRRQSRDCAAEGCGCVVVFGAAPVGFAHARSRAGAHRAHKASDTAGAANARRANTTGDTASSSACCDRQVTPRRRSSAPRSFAFPQKPFV